MRITHIDILKVIGLAVMVWLVSIPGAGPAWAVTPIVVDNIQELRDLSDLTPVSVVVPKMVTAVAASFTDGGFYIEDVHRAAGIKVVPIPGLQATTLGERITVEGTLGKDSNGERIITATGFPTRSWGPDPELLGISSGRVLLGGPPNISGLLVRTWGKVKFKSPDGTYIYLDDGQGGKDPTGQDGVRVIFSPGTSLSALREDDFVVVTGVTGLFEDQATGYTIPVVRARSSDDVMDLGSDSYVDASIDPGGNRTWRIGTSRVEKTLKLQGGNFLLTSFINKDAAPQREYIQGVQSNEFTFVANSVTYSGGSGGWTYYSDSVSTLSNGATQLDIVLSRSAFRVTKHYVLYPGTGLIREWLTIQNAGGQPLELSNPSILESNVMSQDVQNGLELGYFITRPPYPEFGQRLITQSVNQTYSNTFSGRGSGQYLPMLILRSPTERHGVTIGWDYLMPWAAPLGAASGQPFHLGLRLDAFARTVQPGEKIDTPLGFVAVFAGDLDDMGNRVLDWQYQYLWENKKSNYFARPRMAVDFDEPWFGLGGTEENWSRRLSLDLYFTDLSRYAGAGLLWDDAGWYDQWGDWNGPDFSLTTRYLAKHGMEWMLWLPPYSAMPGSRADLEAGPIMTTPGAGQYWLDQSKPSSTQWELNLLNEKAAAYGDYQWRYDMTPAHGTDALSSDQEFRRLNREFLANNSGCGVDNSCGGDVAIGYELAEYGNSTEVTDGLTGDLSGYYSTMLIPPDMFHNVVYGMGQGRKTYSAYCDRIQLRTNPTQFGDPGSVTGLQCGQKNQDYRAEDILAVRAQSIPGLESLRTDWDLYKYLLSKGVVGRWCHVFRPTVTGDDPVLYFQRMNREGTIGVIVTTRSFFTPTSMPAGAVAVYPKGLVPYLTYDVRFDHMTAAQSRLGSDLMQNGITIQTLLPGEIIYLNLPNRPGSHTDTTPPTAPTQVTKKVATNIFFQGVEVSWAPGTDNNWLSYYEVFRISPTGTETNLGKVSQGTFYFDRSDLAMNLIDCRYEVRAVDGDGNASARVEAQLLAGEPETHYAFAGYGSHQGFRGWSYEAVSDLVLIGDAKADFSTTTSSGPVWQYGMYLWSNGSFYNFNTVGADPWGLGMSFWDKDHSVVPFVAKSNNTSPQTTPWGWSLPAQSIIVHPDSADAGTNPYGPGEASVVRWIAPSEVTSIHVSGGFTALAGGTFRGRVYKNMGLLFDTGSVGPNNYTLQSVALNGISVTAGDKIDFAVTYGATYSNNWTGVTAAVYGVVPGANNYLPMTWSPTSGYEGRWVAAQEDGAIGRTFMRPFASGDVARVFTAPRSGTVTLRGLVKKDLPVGVVPANNCRVRIMKNDQQIWPALGWQSVPVDRNGVAYEFTISVQAGDRIVHMLERNEGGASADIAWNPVIEYVN